MGRNRCSDLKLVCFYHCWTEGDWRTAAGEFFTALDDWPGETYVGVAGPGFEQAELPGERVAEAPDAWENLTLDPLYDYCKRHPGAYVLYGHTKGVTHPDVYGTAWRQSMTKTVVAGWRKWVPLLEEFDAVGCHWLTHENSPEHRHELADGFFAGNFWAARADYIASLPRCLRVDRWDAERWIGLGEPRVYDLLPGYPSMSVFV